MPENWLGIAAEVADALGDVGHRATLLRKGPATGPEWDPVFSLEQSFPVTVLQDSISLGLIDGTAILTTDKLFMMAATGVTPTPSDRIALGGVSYAIIRAEPYAPGGIPLFFEVLARM